MNVRIGIIHAPRELEIDMGDDAEPDKLVEEITDAIGEGKDVLWLTDRKGKRIGVASANVAYVEVGPKADSSPVGFKA